MENELNIEECSNNCSILTYFQVMEQVNNFNNIEFEDVPNVFNIDFMNFILKKKFHEIAIVDIFVKWNFISKCFKLNNLKEDFNQMKKDLEELTDEEKYNYLDLSSEMILLIFGTKIVLSDNDILKNPEIIAIETNPLFFLEEEDVFSNAIHELNENSNIKNKESVEQEIFLRMDYYQKLKEIRKIIIESLNLFEDLNNLKEFLINGTSISGIEEIIENLKNVPLEEIINVEEVE